MGIGSVAKRVSVKTTTNDMGNGLFLLFTDQQNDTNTCIHKYKMTAIAAAELMTCSVDRGYRYARLLGWTIERNITKK